MLQIERITKEKLTENMLQRTKAAIKTSLVKSFENSAGINQLIIESVINNKKESLRQVLDKIRSYKSR